MAPNRDTTKPPDTQKNRPTAPPQHKTVTTPHWLHYFQLAKKDGDDMPAIHTSRVMFKPLFLTSIILGLGFGVLGISNLVILQKFGLFTMVAIFMAFVTDIVALPALIRYFGLSKR